MRALLIGLTEVRVLLISSVLLWMEDQDDSTLSRQKKYAEANWKSQKAWEVAQAPAKNLLMMGFMMWMAGSTVHLFSMGIVFLAVWQPIGALQGVGKVQVFKFNGYQLGVDEQYIQTYTEPTYVMKFYTETRKLQFTRRV